MRRKVGNNGSISYGSWKVQLGSEWIAASVQVIESGGKVRVVFGDELITSFSAEEPNRYVASGRKGGKVKLPRRIEEP